MILTKEQLSEYQRGFAELGVLPSKISVGMPEKALYHSVALAHACWEIRDLLDTIADLDRQCNENVKQLKIDISAMAGAEEKILLLESVLKEGARMVESAYAHISHGGPTRGDAMAWVERALVALSVSKEKP